jgi:HK97 family phage major capsid protein
MSTSLLLQVREQVKAKLAEKDTLLKEQEVRISEADAIKAEAEKRGEGDLDPQEAARFRELTGQVSDISKRLKEIDAETEALEERDAQLVTFEEARDNATKAAKTWADRSASTAEVSTVARVKSEARTYSAEAEKRQGTSFYRDLFASFTYRDPEAGARLERHAREARLHEAAGLEYRDVGTSAFAGLTVPQYLTDMAAPIARAMAPTVAITNRHPLPNDGMTVNISRITTGTGVAVQSTDNEGVQETNADDTLLTVNVRTYAGMQDVSRQALERSTGVDDILTQDLVRAYWTTLDDAILNGAGTLGTHTGIRSTGSIVSVTYADTSATVAELYPKLADLIQQIQSGVYMGVTHFIMHPRRWWWLASSVGTSFPFLNVQNVDSTVQAGNIGSTDYMAQNRNILGIPVIVDGNIPTTLGGSTNEDVILGVTAPELHLWHDPSAPLLIRAEQPLANQLAVRFVVYGYSAFTAGRYPGAHGTITSTGLTTPSF